MLNFVVFCLPGLVVAALLMAAPQRIGFAGSLGLAGLAGYFYWQSVTHTPSRSYVDLGGLVSLLGAIGAGASALSIGGFHIAAQRFGRSLTLGAICLGLGLALGLAASFLMIVG